LFWFAAEIFCNVEPYLTFLNIHQLERQGADIHTKVRELEELNQSLRNRDKMKDDAIAQLSDQLMALTTRCRRLRENNRYDLTLILNAIDHLKGSEQS
jgi:hypothetical protein